MVIGFTIVLVTKGLNNLKNTTSSLDQSNLKVSDIILQFQGIATDLRTVGNNANQTRSQIISQLQNFCPNGGNLTGQFGSFKAAGQQTAALLSQLGDFIGSDVANAQQSLTKAQHTTVNLHKALNQFDFHSLTISFVMYVFIKRHKRKSCRSSQLCLIASLFCVFAFFLASTLFCQPAFC